MAFCSLSFNTQLHLVTKCYHTIAPLAFRCASAYWVVKKEPQRGDSMVETGINKT